MATAITSSNIKWKIIHLGTFSRPTQVYWRLALHGFVWHWRKWEYRKTVPWHNNHTVLERGTHTVPDPHILAVCHHDVHSADTMFQQEPPAPGKQSLHKFHTHTERNGESALNKHLFSQLSHLFSSRNNVEQVTSYTSLYIKGTCFLSFSYLCYKCLVYWARYSIW